MSRNKSGMPKEKCGTAAGNKKATPDRMASKTVKTAKIWWPLLGLNQRPSDYEFLPEQPKINFLFIIDIGWCCLPMITHHLPFLSPLYRHYHQSTL
ncbi:hypothetical protein I5L38_03275 [Serratia marcescens]|nr:hypothetical protein [Serratia marcescens]